MQNNIQINNAPDIIQEEALPVRLDLGDFEEGKNLNIPKALPTQNQMPVDTYIYSNSSDIGNTINVTAERHKLDPHKLEAFTNTLRTGKANLDSFTSLEIGYFPGMTADDLVRRIGEVASTYNIIAENKRIAAARKGETYIEDGFDRLVNSLQSIDGKKSGRAYYEEMLSTLQEADHEQFDTLTLTKYYEALIKSGRDKGSAWTETMQKQDQLRAVQDVKAIQLDIDGLSSPEEMYNYANGLHTRWSKEKDSTKALRLYSQYEAAMKLAKTNEVAYNNDPAAYMMKKDKVIQAGIAEAQKTGDWSLIFNQIDKNYDAKGTPQSMRTYISKEQAKAYASEINTFINTDPQKTFETITSIANTFGASAGKVFNQLIRDNNINKNSLMFIEAAKTGSPAAVNDVINMQKFKATYGNDFRQTMLGAPDTSSAKTLYTKLQTGVYSLPGFRAVTATADLVVNPEEKRYYAQFLADMAAYYKFTNPGMSDKQALAAVQRNFIDNTYTYDTEGRVALPKRTLNGKPIMYGEKNSDEAMYYLTNRSFIGQGYSVGANNETASNELLKNAGNIRYLNLDQTRVQPMYQDPRTGTILPLYKNGKEVVFDLPYLGKKEVLDIVTTKDEIRKLTQTISTLNNYTYPLERYKPNIVKMLAEAGFDVEKINPNKPLSEQLDRTNLSKNRIQALTNMILIQKKIDEALDDYKIQVTSYKKSASFVELAQIFIPGAYATSLQGKIYDSAEKKALVDKKYEKNYASLKQSYQNLEKLEKQYLQEASVFTGLPVHKDARPFTRKLPKTGIFLNQQLKDNK